MTDVFGMNEANPPVMTVRRAGIGILPAPEGVASGPFRVQMLLASRTEGEMTAMRAFVEPGTITRWHSHPRGQLLFVVDGIGLAQRAGGPVVEVRAGDSIWFAPGEKHWHGATAGDPFDYVSIQPVQGGTATEWLEPVSDESTCP